MWGCKTLAAGGADSPVRCQHYHHRRRRRAWTNLFVFSLVQARFSICRHFSSLEARVWRQSRDSVTSSFIKWIAFQRSWLDLLFFNPYTNWWWYFIFRRSVILRKRHVIRHITNQIVVVRLFVFRFPPKRSKSINLFLKSDKIQISRYHYLLLSPSTSY